MHGINQGNPQSGNLLVEKKNHKWAEGELPTSWYPHLVGQVE